MNWYKYVKKTQNTNMPAAEDLTSRTREGLAIATGALKCFINMYGDTDRVCEDEEIRCAVYDIQPVMTRLDIYSDRQKSHQPLQPGSHTYITVNVRNNLKTTGTFCRGLFLVGMLIRS